MHDVFFDTGFSPCGFGTLETSPFGGYFGMNQFDGGFNMPMMGLQAPFPMSLGIYQDFVWGDQVPFTPSTPPSSMMNSAYQAEIHLNQLEAQLNDPNLWMKFMPPTPPMSIPSWDNIDWFQPSMAPIDWGNINWADMPTEDPFTDACHSSDLFADTTEQNNPFDFGSNVDTPSSFNGEEVLPCGLTQSQYDQASNKWESIIADYQSQIDRLEPGHNMAVRAMLQNHLHSAERHLRDLGKPIGS